MEKEKIEKSEKSSYELYQEKLQLIKKLVDNINKEFKLEGENCVVSSPDMIIVPVVHKDGKIVQHFLGVFKSEKQDNLKTPVKLGHDENEQWFLTADVISSLLKYGPGLDSIEFQITKKCFEKFKQRTKE